MKTVREMIKKIMKWPENDQITSKLYFLRFWYFFGEI